MGWMVRHKKEYATGTSILGKLLEKFTLCKNIWSGVITTELNKAFLTLFTAIVLKSLYVSQTLVCRCDQFSSPFIEHDPGPTIVHVKAIWNVLVVAHLKPFVTVLLLK